MPFQAFTCHSWLCGPQFETLDPPPANIVAFLREFLPASQGARRRLGHALAGLRLPGPRPFRPDMAPQSTSLQRALVGFLKAGGRCRDASGVLFPEALDWGIQVYRTMQG